MTHRLCEICRVAPLTGDDAKSPDKSMSKAQECKEADRDAYEKGLADEYGHEIYRLRPAYDLLKKLSFQTYVTTNFDPLLAYGAKSINAFPDLNAANLTKKNHVFYLHGIARDGDIPNASDLVFAKDDFDFAYGAESLLPGFLDHFFAYQDVLFIGCRLREPQIENALARAFGLCEPVASARPVYRKRSRCILLKEEYKTNPETGIEERAHGDEMEEEHRLNEVGIDVIRYAASSDEHHEIEQILKCLCERANIAIRRVPPLAAGQEVPLSGR